MENGSRSVTAPTKPAHKLIADTRHLVGREVTLQVLDPATN